MVRLVGLVVSVVVLSSCQCIVPSSGHTGGGPGGGAGGGGGLLIGAYSLASGSAHWSVTGNTGCHATTASSVDWEPELGPSFAAFVGYEPRFDSFLQVAQTTSAREGTNSCATNPTSCPSYDSPAQTAPRFIKISLEGLFANPPLGQTFVPTFEVELPALCDDVAFVAAPSYRRGKPISVAQLVSGRFVVEGEGTEPVYAATGEAIGSLSWTFNFVFQSNTYDASHAVPPPNLQTYDECLLDVQPDFATMAAAVVAIDGGATDIALNVSGCRRLKVIREPGVTELRNELTVGTTLDIDGDGKPRSSPIVVTTFRQRVDSDGVHESSVAFRDAGEVTSEFLYAADGSWVGTITQEHTPDGTAIREYEMQPGPDAGTILMTVTNLITGEVDEPFITSENQNRCFEPDDPPNPDCEGTGGGTGTTGGGTGNTGGGSGGCTPTGDEERAPACSNSDAQKFKKKLIDAMAKGSQCLKDRGFKTFDPGGPPEALVVGDTLNFRCTAKSCDPYGSLMAHPRKDGTRDITVNTARGDAEEMVKVLFHESLHIDDRFNHNDDMVAAAGHACKLQMADRAYACETMCFAPSRGGSCACMRCLNANPAEPDPATCYRCLSFGSCPRRATDVSSSVGGWCGRTSKFCDTKTECDQACSISGGRCEKPIKSTCQTDCN